MSNNDGTSSNSSNANGGVVRDGASSNLEGGNSSNVVSSDTTREFKGTISNTDSNSNDRFTAGSKILSKFQNQWEQLHAKSESNVSKAKTALAKIDNVERDATRRLNALNQFIESYKSLSKLENHIKIIDNDLKSLESCFVQIENILIVLRGHKEQKDLEQYVASREANYESEVRQRQCLSEVRKKRLKAEHLKRVETFELEQERRLEERRKILGRAFEEEKSRYLEKAKNGT